MMEGLLCNAFWAALLLTGDAARAEEVVQAAIEFLDADDLSSDALLIFVGTLASQLDGDESLLGGDESVLPVLPKDLQNVMRLPRMKRQCFVLRILLGFPEGRCARLLHVQDRRISDEVGVAMSELASMSDAHSHSCSGLRT
jgi:DNA-directed RNA polymerase specialized sigma24 family protein